MSARQHNVIVRNTQAADFDDIIKLTRQVYPFSLPWGVNQLSSHLTKFPEGQFVAEETNSKQIVGMAASLIIHWDDYDTFASWAEFTDYGMFTNHDPSAGRTLYGAEVMVHPKMQGQGIGSKLYAARRELTERFGLLRIRAAARLRGYGAHSHTMSAEQYVTKVVHGELRDPTLSFQLKHGFEVITIVSDYLRNDTESLGWAAVIEWLNPAVATPQDYAKRSTKFLKKN